ncbi:MAG: putative secreted protein, AYWB SAP20-like [Candidatus Phytoplasma cynodontis]|nr:MAG: putative secreted protein, AYWB SAP20-like [Candidatus Phytoplasma cynodontis]
MKLNNKYNIKKNIFLNKNYFKFIFILFLFIFQQNHLFAMNPSTSTYRFPSKYLKLTSNSASIKKLEKLNHKLNSNSNEASFYDILKSIKIDLNYPQHLGVNSLDEILSKFSEILINFYVSIDFYQLFPNYDNPNHLNYLSVQKQDCIASTAHIPLCNFESLFEEGQQKLKLKNNTNYNEPNSRIIYSFVYDTQSHSYVGSQQHTRLNADNVLDLVLDIEITKSPDENKIPIIFLFKTYSYTTENLFFDFCLGIENISFTKKI